MAIKEEIDKKLAKGYMQEIVASLRYDFPVLSPALNLLKFRLVEERDGKRSMFYDGEYVHYNYKEVLRIGDIGVRDSLKRDVLHIVFHGLLDHFSSYERYESKKIADVAMDRIVEHMVGKIIPDEYASDVEKEMNKYLGENFDMGCYYKGKRKIYVGKKMIFWGKHLKRDDHSKWTRIKEDLNGMEIGIPIAIKWDKARKAICGILNVRDIQQKDFANKLVMSLNKGKGYGTLAGDSEEIINADEGEGASYREIILKHLTTKNKDKEEPDTIDNMMYQYGLEMYGDVPLIEPIDENEIASLNTICIALDVSGSCGNEIASIFLRETKNMLQDLKRVCSGGEVYYWECDEELQKEEYYESVEEVSSEDWKCREMRGFGGTSFIPVFKRIDNLIREGKEIDCLIYLTDGAGLYPKEKPMYPVYFVLPPDLYGYEVEIPKWINCIELKE